MTVRALRSTAQRIQLLTAEAAVLEVAITKLVRAAATWLLELPGIGPLSAAQVLVSWSHPGRVRSEAAFAALAGVSPIPASSGRSPATGSCREPWRLIAARVPGAQLPGGSGEAPEARL
jgi:transposase